MARMNRTATRACLPVTVSNLFRFLNFVLKNFTAVAYILQNFDGEELMKCIIDLIVIDQEWVPYSNTSSLYIRPTLIGTEVS